MLVKSIGSDGRSGVRTACDVAANKQAGTQTGEQTGGGRKLIIDVYDCSFVLFFHR